ncbi:MAG: sigma-70 family RNA polymerase sigma factor, partial [Deltaproteobacteria bacterium]|nr:sigma-70 family RNA polymerase sigma factor [Deltaproteobacteria bacterium]
SVPRVVEREMRSLLLDIGGFGAHGDIEQRLISAGSWIPPEERRSRYISSTRLVVLVRLWLHFHPNRSKRFLARKLSHDLQDQGLRLAADTLKPILAGKRFSARREVLEKLLFYLAPFGVTSEDSAQELFRNVADDIDRAQAGRKPVAAARFHELAKLWQWRNRGASKRKLAERLKQTLADRGIAVDFRRLQSLLSGAGGHGQQREYEVLQMLVHEYIRDDRRFHLALKRVEPGRAVATDLEWVKAKPVADLARLWLADHPGVSQRRLAFRIIDTAKKLGYSVGLSAIQSLLANRTQRARGFIYRAMLGQFENQKRARIPLEHILYPTHRATFRKVGAKKRRSSRNKEENHAQYYGTDVLDLYLHEIGSVPRLSREKEYEIAKRIDEADSEKVAAIATSGIGKRAIRNLINRVRLGQQSARALVRSFDDDPVSDPERHQRLIQTIDAIVGPVEGSSQVSKPLGFSNRSTKSNDKTQHLSERRDVLLERNLVKMKLSKTAIERIVDRIDRLVRLAAKAERKRNIAQNELRLYEKTHDPLELSRKTVTNAQPSVYREVTTNGVKVSKIRDDIAIAERRLERIEKVAGVPIDRLRVLERIESRAERESIRAMQELVEANLPLVVWVARRYRQNGMPFSDLIQEGNIGLIKAINRFDHRRGIRFSSYAFWWIRACIMRAIDDQSRSIRISVPALDKIRWLRRAGYVFSNRIGREVTLEEIAERTDTPVEKVRSLLETPNRTLSLDVSVYEDGSAVFGDFIPDKNVTSPSEAAAFNELRERLIQALSGLTTRERIVLQMRFGLNDSIDCTLQEIGGRLHLSRERIRQIEVDALEKMRRLLNLNVAKNPPA